MRRTSKALIQKVLNPQTEKEWEILLMIQKEVPYVDIKPYSHNIINLELNLLSSYYDDEKMNKVIDLFHLDELGWEHI